MTLSEAAEIVARFMEPLESQKQFGKWWGTVPNGKYIGDQTLRFAPIRPDLDALHEVEERLTEEQKAQYCATFSVKFLPEPAPDVPASYEEQVSWDFSHLSATAEQKLLALAETLHATSTLH